MINIIKNILNRENIVYTDISKVSSGFTNTVYFVDNYVIKLTNDKNIVKKIIKRNFNLQKYKIEKYTFLYYEWFL